MLFQNQISMRPTSAHLKSILPKFLLIPFQKSINTYANPGALFMEIYPPADSLLHPSIRLLILNTLQIIIIKREYQQILRLPAPISEIQISHFTTPLSPNLRVVKLKPSRRI